MLKLSLFISLAATLGSLYFSEIKGLAPCSLCWYQRILMYPLIIIIVIAMAKGDRFIKYYIRAFSFIGLGVALYQYIIQTIQVHSAFCDINVDCTTVSIKYLGFITIPLMSICAFLLLFLFSFFLDGKNKFNKGQIKNTL